MGSFMLLHEKLSVFRNFRGLTQEEMAEKLNMSLSGYAKIERGETRLQTNKLEKIVAALEIELKDFISFDEKMVFNASFSHVERAENNQQNCYINSAKDLTHEIEKLQLIVKQKDEENKLLREQNCQLKEMIELMKQMLK